jgi:hypothetical protein
VLDIRISTHQRKKKKKKKKPNHYFNYLTKIFFVNFVCAVGEGTIGTSE